MARNSMIGYKGSLDLEKIVGVRHDLNQKMWQVKVKKERDIRNDQAERSRKVRANYTKNGEQY